MNHSSARPFPLKIFTRLGRWLGPALIVAAVSPLIAGQVKPKTDDRADLRSGNDILSFEAQEATTKAASTIKGTLVVK
jgi:hypothetical protein